MNDLTKTNNNIINPEAIDDKMPETVDDEGDCISEDELLELLQNAKPAVCNVDVNIDNVQNMKLDDKSFKKGIKEVSNICGQYSALKATGLPDALISDVINTLLNAEYGCKINKMNSDASVQISKNQIHLIAQETVD